MNAARWPAARGPAGRPGGADASDAGAAASECGEHAETDGVETNARWTAGCVDGAPAPGPSPGS